MVKVVARVLAVGTVAVKLPTAPPATGPLSASSVATSPLPTPARLLRTDTPPGAVHVRAAVDLSDHTDSTQLPAAAVAAGVGCDVPAGRATLATDAIGFTVDVPAYAASCRVTFDDPDSVTVTVEPASDAVATRENTCVFGPVPDSRDPAAAHPAGAVPDTVEFVDSTSTIPSPACTDAGTVTCAEVTARAEAPVAPRIAMAPGGGGGVAVLGARTTVKVVARELAVGTVAVRLPTAPPATGPLSASSVATSPLPTPARLLRTATPDGGVQVRAAVCLSDHTESTQLPAAAVADGVGWEVPAGRAVLATDAIGFVVDVPA